MSKASPKKRLSFIEEYERLTLLESSYPLPYVINNINNNCIELNADRIRLNEWDSILGALRRDNTLKFLSLRSTWNHSIKGENKKIGIAKKRPPVRTRAILAKLARSLKDFLYGNTCLECLVLQNLPFREEDIALIAKGILKVRSLKSFSMEQCPLKDVGLIMLTESIKRCGSIVTVNFTKCGLTWKSAETLASTIKFQGTQRHNEAWQASLRYRKPDLDHMSGLRRITICQNKIGDDGVKILADILKDDLWLKALDMQQCSISTDGAAILKNALNFNSALVVLDVRRNPAISYNCLRSIIEVVMVHAGGEHLEYPWINNKEMNKNDTTTATNIRKTSSFSRKPKVPRRKSLEERKPRMQKTHEHSRNRTRIRNERSKSRYPIQEQLIESEADEMEARAYNQRQLDISKDLLYGLSPHQRSERHSAMFSRELEFLKSELDLCKTQLHEEKEKNRKAEIEMENLKHSNSVLTQSLEHYKIKLKEMEKQSKKNVLDLNFPDLTESDLLDNDKALDSIESSFKQFQQFLDMLKNLGLSDVYNTNFTKPDDEEKV